MQSLCNSLQLKYDQLEKQRNSTNTVRVLSANCSDCSRLRRDYDELKIRYEEVQKNENSRISSSTRVYSTVSCNDCPKLRVEIKTKDDTISNIRSQISNYTAKILTLEGQLYTLNATSSKPAVVYTQTVSRPGDLQRIAYLNGQVQQYLALVNSLRSEIKVLNEENQRYTYRIRELESRPREVQLVEKELSTEIRQEMRALKVEVGQLSNDNILLRRENANLKREIMSVQKTSHIIIQQPMIPIQEERPSRHYRKPMTGRRNYESSLSVEKLAYPQKMRYDDLDRKIQMLQMENDYLKGTFYSEI